jgi:acyl-CoA thioester hydrolase
MTHGLICDSLNPKFVFASPVFSDELSTTGELPVERLTDHVDHALAAWYVTAAETCKHPVSDGLDPKQVVRDTTLELLNPVDRPVVMRIDVWVEDLDAASCVYGFTLSSEDGRVPFARGERTVTHVDPNSNRPQPWSDAFRTSHEVLLKDLPAFG